MEARPPRFVASVNRGDRPARRLAWILIGLPILGAGMVLWGARRETLPTRERELDSNGSQARRESRPGSPAPQGQRRLAESGTSDVPQDARTKALFIVDRQGLAVAGAQVAFLGDASSDDARAFDDLDRIDSWMTERAVRGVADPVGRFDLPQPRGRPTLVLASGGGAWGRTRVSDSHDGRIVLDRDVTLCVRVTNVDGRALDGATVEILRRDDGPWSSVRTAQTAGKEPVARFPHAQVTLQPTAGRSWSIASRDLFADPPAQPLDLAAAAAGTLELQLPAAGAVVVQVQDESGRLLADGASVSLGILSSDEAIGRSRPAERAVREGFASFSFVELGRNLEIRARREGARAWTRALDAGPIQSGETRRLTLRLGSDHPVAWLRALDERGDPLAELSTNVVLETQDGSSEPIESTTDEAGRLFVDLVDIGPRGAHLLLSTRSIDAGPELRGRIELPGDLPPGLQPVRDVWLAASPLLVRGLARTSVGIPAAGARLVLLRRDPPEQAWRLQTSFHGNTDAYGAFEVRGDFPEAEYRLGAIAKGELCAPRPFRRGEELALDMLAEGVIEGRALIDSQVPRERLKVVIRGDRAETEHLESRECERPLSDDGRFRFGKLLTGIYTLMVMSQDDAQPLATVEGVVAESGEAVEDPRLDPIALTLFTHQVRLLAPGDEAPFEGEVFFGPAAAPELRGRREFQGREIVLVTAANALDVVVKARGHATARVTGVRERVELVLQSGPTVHVVLRGEGELPEAPTFVGAALVPLAQDEPRSRPLGNAYFDRSRKLCVQVPGPGRMRVEWYVERREAESARGCAVFVRPEQFVEVGSVAEQSVVVELSAQQMEQVVAALDDVPGRPPRPPGGR